MQNKLNIKLGIMMWNMVKLLFFEKYLHISELFPIFATIVN